MPTSETPSHTPSAAQQATTPDLGRVGVVAIGRNEGERLKMCLRSVVGRVGHVVYVDSGSTDGSVAFAESLGVEVVALDMSRPFTAARARNTGIARLRELGTELAYVQTVDGDCEVIDGWLAAGVAALDGDAELGVVCGRVRERHPEATVYNRLADMEWAAPPGEAKACGGNAMWRLSALEQAEGFDDALIAGEEPELCFRMRAEGWRVRRLPEEMVWHDAAMTRFGQWWKRAKRSGHACAEAAAMHGDSPERYHVKERRSMVAWGLVLPIGVGLLLLIAAGLAVFGEGWGRWVAAGLAVWAGLGVLMFGVLMAKIARYRARQGDRPDHAWTYARWCVAAKVPESWGVMTYWINRRRGRATRLIEYKGPDKNDANLGKPAEASGR